MFAPLTEMKNVPEKQLEIVSAGDKEEPVTSTTADSETEKDDGIFVELGAEKKKKPIKAEEKGGRMETFLRLQNVKVPNGW